MVKTDVDNLFTMSVWAPIDVVMYFNIKNQITITSIAWSKPTWCCIFSITKNYFWYDVGAWFKPTWWLTTWRRLFNWRYVWKHSTSSWSTSFRDSMLRGSQNQLWWPFFYYCVFKGTSIWHHDMRKKKNILISYETSK